MEQNRTLQVDQWCVGVFWEGKSSVPQGKAALLPSAPEEDLIKNEIVAGNGVQRRRACDREEVRGFWCCSYEYPKHKRRWEERMEFGAKKGGKWKPPANGRL